MKNKYLAIFLVSLFLYNGLLTYRLWDDYDNSCESKQKSDEEILGEIANRNSHTNPGLSIVLHTMLGAMSDGSFDEFVSIAIKYSETRIEKSIEVEEVPINAQVTISYAGEVDVLYLKKETIYSFRDQFNEDLIIRIRVDTLNTLKRL